MGTGMKQGAETAERRELPHSLGLAQKLEESDNDELIRENLGLMLRSIEEDLGIKLVSDVGKLYDGMQLDNCLVRVERLSRVLETVELQSPLKISEENEQHYANAVIPNPDGIKIALSEGQAPGPMRIMVGFGKTIIGFKTDNISVEEIEFDESDIRDAKERRYLCRHVSGELSKDDIRYLVMRIPFSFVKEEYLTDLEKRDQPQFVFRGARLAVEN